MPQLTMPTEFSSRIEAVTFQVSYSSQVELRSPWTGTSQVLDRGFPVWIGTCRVARIGGADPGSAADRLAIEAFLSSFEGVGNWFELPHHRGTLEAGVSAVVNSSALTADVLVHTLAASLTDAVVGTRVRSGNYLYSIRDIRVGNQYVLDPQRPIAVGESIGASDTIRVTSSTQQSPVMPDSLDAAGPWTLSFREF